MYCILLLNQAVVYMSNYHQNTQQTVNYVDSPVLPILQGGGIMVPWWRRPLGRELAAAARLAVIYTVNRKKRGSTFDIITLEKHARFL